MKLIELQWNIISKKLLKNFSWTILAKAVAMIGFFALDISMARILGKNSYGEWSFFYSAIIMLAHICWFGINASVKVFVSKQETKEELSDCLKASVKLRFITSFIFLIVISGSTSILSDYLERSSKYQNIHILMYGAGILVFLSSFTEFYKAMNIGLQKYRNLFFVTLMEYGGYFVFSVAAVMLLKTNVGILAGYVLAGIFTTLLGSAFIRADILKKEKNKNRQKVLIKEILIYAMPLLVTSIGEILLEESDTFFLGLFSVPAQVSVYAIGKKLCSKVHHINYTFCITVLPQFSVINQDDYKEKLTKLKKYAVLNIFLSIVVAMGLLVFSGFIIDFLYGTEYGEAKFIFRLLLIYYLQHSISYYFALFLEFQKKAVFESVCYFITIVLNIILEIWLVPIYGALGATVATIISYMPYTVLIIMKAICVQKQCRAAFEE